VIDIDPGHPSDKRRSLSTSLGSRDVEIRAESSFYVSKSYAEKTRALRAAIWAEFNGTNHNSLAERHGVSRQFIYWTIRAGDPATNPN
jgi:Mor family transcriptional regulator